MSSNVLNSDRVVKGWLCQGYGEGKGGFIVIDRQTGGEAIIDQEKGWWCLGVVEKGMRDRKMVWGLHFHK